MDAKFRKTNWSRVFPQIVDERRVSGADRDNAILWCLERIEANQRSIEHLTKTTSDDIRSTAKSAAERHTELEGRMQSTIESVLRSLGRFEARVRTVEEWVSSGFFRRWRKCRVFDEVGRHVAVLYRPPPVPSAAGGSAGPDGSGSPPPNVH